MIICVSKEIRTGETRVAIVPDTVKKLTGLGIEVQIEKSAGKAAGFDDEEYRQSGAVIGKTADKIYEEADIVLKINAPEESEFSRLRQGCVIIANFRGKDSAEYLKKAAQRKASCLALDRLPRLSKTQSMDILSSQSNLAGYEAVITAVKALNKAVPMMMTAAGTIAPAKVLVLGTGVAGLQAIATAKRLGAQVFASDVRPQMKEQAESLGARFLETGNNETFETDSGYAKETSREYQLEQQRIVAEQLKKTDIVITTALLPGKRAPILITKKMIENMPKGSVIVDLAAAEGGNTEGCEDQKTNEYAGVSIIGAGNPATGVPYSASQMFSRNLFNFLQPFYREESRSFEFDYSDELIRAVCLLKRGEML